MEHEYKSSHGEEADDGNGPGNTITQIGVEAGVAAGEGVGLILYWASGLWLIVGLWAWIHPKSLQTLIGSRYAIVYPGREAKARKDARKAAASRSE